MIALKTATLLCGVAAAAQAQAASAEVVGQSGMTRVVLRAPEGLLRVNFPDDMAAGDRIVGTVYTEPAGKDKKERDGNAARLAQYGFELEAGNASLSGNRVHWQIPDGAPRGGLTIRFRDRSNKVVAAADLPISPGTADAPGYTPPPSLQLPTEGPAGGAFTVWGSLPPVDATASVGRTPAALLAQGPRKAVFLSPPDTVGQNELEVKAGPVALAGPFYTISLVLTATQLTLRTGQSAQLTATVGGLAGIKGPALLTLANRTPSVAAMSGGAVQRVSIAPSDVAPDGTFRVIRTLVAERDGTFEVTGSVTRSIVDRLPVQELAGSGVDRWSRKNNVPVAPDARTLIVQEFAAERARLDEFLATQAAMGADPGTLLRALVAEYCFELRDVAARALGRAGAVRPERVRWAAAFAPQGAVLPPVTITKATVSAHPVLEFLGRLFGSLAPEAPTGVLSVLSAPLQKQPIVIDRQTGTTFLTPQTFTVNVGAHQVSVRSCQKTVQVPPNLAITVQCDVQ